MAEQQTLNLFTDLSAQYLSYCEALGYAIRAKYHLWTLWVPAFGDRDPDTITADEIQDLVDREAKKNGWAQQTRTHAITTLSGFMKWLQKRRHIKHNPTTLVPRISGSRLKNERRYVLPKDKLQELLRALHKHPGIKDLVEAGYRTGLRFSKLVNLQVSDLHYDSDGTPFLEVFDKNQEFHRIFLYDRTWKLMEFRLRLAEKAGSEYLFFGCHGGQFTQKSVRKYLIPACKIIGIEWGNGRYQFSFHSLRRSYASNAFSNGVTIEELMATGNWKSYSALKRYALMNGEARKRSFKKLSKAL